MKDFKHKVVVITGGATGIGFAFAKRLGKEGAKVVIGGIREDRVNKAASSLKELNIDSASLVCNVTKEDDLIKLEAFARNQFGSVDVLINNAGIGGVRKTVFEMTAAEAQQVLDVNFYAVWNAIRIFGKEMIASATPCAIYNVGSENSFFNAVKRSADYIVSKHAIHALTKSLREDAPSFMDVGLIIPGFVFTEIGPEQMMQFGMAADEFVDRLIPQMKAGEFYIVSHPYNAVRITEAYEEVKQAFETYAPRFDGDEAYDVQLLMEQFKKQ